MKINGEVREYSKEQIPKEDYIDFFSNVDVVDDASKIIYTSRDPSDRDIDLEQSLAENDFIKEVYPVDIRDGEFKDDDISDYKNSVLSDINVFRFGHNDRPTLYNVSPRDSETIAQTKGNYLQIGPQFQLNDLDSDAITSIQVSLHGLDPEKGSDTRPLSILLFDQEPQGQIEYEIGDGQKLIMKVNESDSGKIDIVEQDKTGTRSSTVAYSEKQVGDEYVVTMNHDPSSAPLSLQMAEGLLQQVAVKTELLNQIKESEGTMPTARIVVKDAEGATATDLTAKREFSRDGRLDGIDYDTNTTTRLESDDTAVDSAIVKGNTYVEINLGTVYELSRPTVMRELTDDPLVILHDAKGLIVPDSDEMAFSLLGDADNEYMRILSPSGEKITKVEFERVSNYYRLGEQSNEEETISYLQFEVDSDKPRLVLEGGETIIYEVSDTGPSYEVTLLAQSNTFSISSNDATVQEFNDFLNSLKIVEEVPNLDSNRQGAEIYRQYEMTAYNDQNIASEPYKFDFYVNRANAVQKINSMLDETPDGASETNTEYLTNPENASDYIGVSRLISVSDSEQDKLSMELTLNVPDGYVVDRQFQEVNYARFKYNGEEIVSPPPQFDFPVPGQEPSAADRTITIPRSSWPDIAFTEVEFIGPKGLRYSFTKDDGVGNGGTGTLIPNSELTSVSYHPFFGTDPRKFRDVDFKLEFPDGTNTNKLPSFMIRYKTDKNSDYKNLFMQTDDYTVSEFITLGGDKLLSKNEAGVHSLLLGETVDTLFAGLPVTGYDETWGGDSMDPSEINDVLENTEVFHSYDAVPNVEPEAPVIINAKLSDDRQNVLVQSDVEISTEVEAQPTTAEVTFTTSQVGDEVLSINSTEMSSPFTIETNLQGNPGQQSLSKIFTIGGSAQQVFGKIAVEGSEMLLPGITPGSFKPFTDGKFLVVDSPTTQSWWEFFPDTVKRLKIEILNDEWKGANVFTTSDGGTLNDKKKVPASPQIDNSGVISFSVRDDQIGITKDDILKTISNAYLGYVNNSEPPPPLEYRVSYTPLDSTSEKIFYLQQFSKDTNKYTISGAVDLTENGLTDARYEAVFDGVELIKSELVFGVVETSAGQISTDEILNVGSIQSALEKVDFVAEQDTPITIDVDLSTPSPEGENNLSVKNTYTVEENPHEYTQTITSISVEQGDDALLPAGVSQTNTDIETTYLVHDLHNLMTLEGIDFNPDEVMSMQVEIPILKEGDPAFRDWGKSLKTMFVGENGNVFDELPKDPGDYYKISFIEINKAQIMCLTSAETSKPFNPTDVLQYLKIQASETSGNLTVPVTIETFDSSNQSNEQTFNLQLKPMGIEINGTESATLVTGETYALSEFFELKMFGETTNRVALAEITLPTMPVDMSNLLGEQSFTDSTDKEHKFIIAQKNSSEPVLQFKPVAPDTNISPEAINDYLRNTFIEIPETRDGISYQNMIMRVDEVDMNGMALGEETHTSEIDGYYSSALIDAGNYYQLSEKENIKIIVNPASVSFQESGGEWHKLEIDLKGIELNTAALQIQSTSSDIIFAYAYDNQAGKQDLYMTRIPKSEFENSISADPAAQGNEKLIPELHLVQENIEADVEIKLLKSISGDEIVLNIGDKQQFMTNGSDAFEFETTENSVKLSELTGVMSMFDDYTDMDLDKTQKVEVTAAEHGETTINLDDISDLFLEDYSGDGELNIFLEKFTGEKLGKIQSSDKFIQSNPGEYDNDGHAYFTYADNHNIKVSFDTDAFNVMNDSEGMG